MGRLLSNFSIRSAARIIRSENNFIDKIFFNDFPLLRTLGPEYFSQNQRATGVLDPKIDSIADVIEKGFEAGVAVSFGGLFGLLGEPGKKGQNLIRGDGFQFSITKFV